MKPPLSAKETDALRRPGREAEEECHPTSPANPRSLNDTDLALLTGRIKKWGRELGFQQVGITGIDLAEDEARLVAWLEQGRMGEMDYLVRHGVKRARPAELVPGTLRVLSARMEYLPEAQDRLRERLEEPTTSFISRYALGRDYHKLMRTRLQRLAERITAEIGPFGHRAFVDSAPVLEKALAHKAGLEFLEALGYPLVVQGVLDAIRGRPLGHIRAHLQVQHHGLFDLLFPIVDTDGSLDAQPTQEHDIHEAPPLR